MSDADKRPDDKTIQKRIKDVGEVSKKLSECSKQLKTATEHVKELDKLLK
jgi:hypothetical protein